MKYRVLTLLLCAALIVSLLSACNNQAATPSEPSASKPVLQDTTSALPSESDSTEPPQSASAAPQAEIPESQLEPIRTAASTQELYELFSSQASEDVYPESGEQTDLPDGGDVNLFADGMSIRTPGESEGDTVKTDGSYLYVLGQADFKIVLADGANTKLLSTTSILSGTDSRYESANAMYLDGTTLVIVTSQERYYDWAGPDGDVDKCCVKLYDVSDPAAPKLQSELAQDGYYLDSRLVDGQIYLVSMDYKLSPQEEPRSYLPTLWEGETTSVLDLDKIYICPDERTYCYTIASVFDVGSARRVDACAFTGGCNAAYMDETGLYLARYVNVESESEPYAVDQYSVVSVRSSGLTELKKVTLADGNLSLAASAYVDGEVLGKNAMNVYHDTLRLATSANTLEYQVFTDENYGWSNTKMGDSSGGNYVWVLDTGLQVLGSAEDVAPGERIYMAHFAGDLAMFVANEVVAVDLSDPATPQILDKLVVPGYPEYLQPYQEGKLLGLEVQDDLGLQAVTFDVTNPGTPSVESQLDLSQYGWEAVLHNPYAVMLDASEGMAALPSDDCFVLLRYDGSALRELGTVQFPVFSDRSRVVRVGETLYLCDPQAVLAVEVNTLKVVANLPFGVG